MSDSPTATGGPAVSSGVEKLDAVLGGGYPSERATLVEGGPGAGKTTLAMQFLQAGIEAGEECLFLSTEQTGAELRDSLGEYPFDLDAENLTITSIHVQPGQAREDMRDGFVTQRYTDDPDEFLLRTLTGDADIDERWISFDAANVREYVAGLGPFDRVVVDSVTGLLSMSSDPELFRRSVLDLIRVFSDTHGATTLLTAERRDGPDGNLLRYNAHGVVEVTTESVFGSRRRFLSVAKMRGVDHDTRRYELDMDREHGVRLFPRERTRAEAVNPYDTVETGLEGFDELLGGGITGGAPVVLEHEGLVDLDVVNAGLFNRALANGASVLLTAPPSWNCETLDTYLHGDETVRSLMNGDRLFVVSGRACEDMVEENVFQLQSSTTVDEYLGALQSMYERASGRTWTVADTQLLSEFFSVEELNRLWRLVNEAELYPGQVLTAVFNRSRGDERLREFLHDISPQVVRFSQQENGLTYASLRKSPTGEVGDTKLVDYPNTPPYVAFH